MSTERSVVALLLVAFATALAGCGSSPTTNRTDATVTPTTGAPTMADPSANEPTTTSLIPDSSSTVRISYGDGPQQFGDLSIPGGDTPVPVVVLIHGGFWRNQYDLTLMEPLADDLVDRGYAVWNLEYRRIGDDGGAWPGTLDDVAAGIDALADAARDHALDLDRVAFVGHSAGGHLALWAAGRAALPADAPGSAPDVTPVVAIGQGAVVDLVGGAEDGLGGGAVVDLVGGTPTEYPDRYVWATPALGAGPQMVSIVGSADTNVPPPYSLDPRQPGAIETIEIEGADHFDLIDPSSSAWQAVVTRLNTSIS
jgi:acetyl esterase/lipase